MDLRQRLQLIVEATTGRADAEFRKLTGTTRELGTTADRAADQVRSAAQRVADAREAEARAAAGLRVAEQRLVELRESGRAKASQLIAAEERAAAAQRTLQRAVAGTERALRDEQEALAGATRSMDDAGRGGGLLAAGVGRAQAALVGIGAAGVGEFLRRTAEGFTEAARSAGLFATSTNSSVAEASQFLGLVGTLGLDLNDLLEIQAEYAQKAAASSDQLAAMGAELQRNADGSVNWTRSLVAMLVSLQRIPDATERNRLGFQFFGEEGYKQLSRLVASGVSVADALEQIGTPFTQADVQAAAEFDAAMMGLSLAGRQAGQDLGRILVPAATDVLELFSDMVGVVTAVPGPIVVATAAALTMGLTGFSPAAAAGARLAAVTALASRNLALFRTAAAIGGASAAAFGAAAGAASAGVGLARAGVGRLAALAGGPLGIALIAGSVAMAEAADGAQRLEQRARDAAVALGQMADQDDLNIATRRTANQLEETAGYWERSAAYVRGYQEDLTGFSAGIAPLLAPFQRLTMGFGDTADTARGFELSIQEAREQLGEFGLQQQQAQESTRSLNDLVAQGVTSGTEFGHAVALAADQQNRQAQTSGLAQAAIDAYNAVTRDATQTTLDLWSAQLRQRGGLIGLQQSIQEAADAVDDSSTPWNEVDEAVNRVIGSVLDYASTSADAAVAAARASGQIVDAQAEASIRGRETIRSLYEALQQPGLTDSARKQIQDMIHDLQEAQENGDVEAVLRLTGADTAKGELDDATKDRETHVRVESRNGPAVAAYLDGLTAQRLSLIRVESRNGPAVRDYLDGLAQQERLAIIRVETRNGPAVDRYLDQLATQERVAWIDVRERGGGGAGGGSSPTGAMLRGAPGAVGTFGAGGGVTVQNMTVQLVTDNAGRVTTASMAAAGRDVVAQIRAYERRNGTGWRTGGAR